jgi:hypothetical protein
VVGTGKTKPARHRFLPDRQSTARRNRDTGKFDSQLSVLEKFPHISQENAYFDGVLDFKIKGLPYVVVYKVFPERRTVEILAVLHERKNRADSKNYRL